MSNPTNGRAPVRARSLLLALTLAMVLMGTAAGSAVALPAKFWGVVPQTTLSEEQFQRLKQGGVDSMRIPIEWGLVQPDNTQTFDFSSVDPLVAGAARRNIEVLPFMTGAPAWAVASVRVPGDASSFVPARLPVNGPAAGAWNRFLKGVVGRYGPRGSFWVQNPDIPKRPIRTWQIWNEPNFKYFVAKPNGAEYGKLVKRSYAALKQADAGARLVLAGLFSEPKGCLREKRPVSPCAQDFLELMYKRNPGIRTKFNGVAVHPYSDRFNEVGGRIENVRRVLAKNRDAGKGLWVTELSWSSQPPVRGNSFAKGEAGQATQMRGAFQVLKRNQAKWRIQRLYWFSVGDLAGSCNFCDGSGLFGEGFAPKKSWREYVRFAGGRP